MTMKTTATRTVLSENGPSLDGGLTNNGPDQPLKLDPDNEWGFFDNDGLETSETETDDDDADANKAKALSSPGNWTSWGCRKLVRIVKAAKGAASKPLIDFIKMHLRGTKLIFVMGQSGTGKTTILRELTGLDLKVGETMGSGTLQYHVCPAVIDGEQYLFVDTAGFGAADLDNMSNFRDIMSCLSVMGPFVTVAGVLFVYGPPKKRINIEDLRTVRWIECFCGPEFFSNITIVTSQWDEYSKTGFLKACDNLTRLEEHEAINQILNPPGRYHGGAIYHHGFPGGQGSIELHQDILGCDTHAIERGDELRELIRRRYTNVKPARLQIVREMELGIPALETQAARVLDSHMVDTVIHISDNRAILVSLNQYDKSSSKPHGPVARVQEDQMGSQSSQTESKPCKGSGAEKSKQTQSKRGPTLIQRLIGWFAVASTAASYFQEARKANHESSNKPGRKTGPAWNLLTSVQNWWSGSS